MPLEVMVQTKGVVAVNVTVRPDDDVAESVGVVPIAWLPGSANVIVCPLRGVTPVEAVLALDVPAAFVAVTVKV